MRYEGIDGVSQCNNEEIIKRLVLCSTVVSHLSLLAVSAEPSEHLGALRFLARLKHLVVSFLEMMVRHAIQPLHETWTLLAVVMFL